MIIGEKAETLTEIQESTIHVQWNLRIKDTWGPEQVSFIQRWPLFGASFIGGSTVHVTPSPQ